MKPGSTKIQSLLLNKAFELLQKKKFGEAETLLAQGLQEAKENKNKILEGLFYSAHGIYHKLKKEFRKAWKYYEKAEKLIPDDPALKIITARLLIDSFGQHDLVIKKMEKIIPLVGRDPTFLHPIYTILGLAYLKKGNRQKAVECVLQSMGADFLGLQTAANLDFRLVEALLQKKAAVPECRIFLEKALLFSKQTKEVSFQKLISQMLALFPD